MGGGAGMEERKTMVHPSCSTRVVETQTEYGTRFLYFILAAIAYITQVTQEDSRYHGRDYTERQERRRSMGAYTSLQ